MVVGYSRVSLGRRKLEVSVKRQDERQEMGSKQDEVGFEWAVTWSQLKRRRAWPKPTATNSVGFCASRFRRRPAQGPTSLTSSVVLWQVSDPPEPPSMKLVSFFFFDNVRIYAGHIPRDHKTTSLQPLKPTAQSLRPVTASSVDCQDIIDAWWPAILVSGRCGPDSPSPHCRFRRDL
jgi:hypothetical protein